MIDSFLKECTNEIRAILGENAEGIYLHGSLVLGGFVPEKSDVDLIVVTKKSLHRSAVLDLTRFFLKKSGEPFPIEVSVLNLPQLKKWQHPSRFEFHYSEAWRTHLEKLDPPFLNVQGWTDPDLAAHLMIIRKKGRVLYGSPIERVFPQVGKEDYLSAILGDFEECVENVLDDPVYCVLNMVRVYRYLKEGDICSKEDAAEWGSEALRHVFHQTLDKVLRRRKGEWVIFSKEELRIVSEDLKSRVDSLMSV